MATFNKPAYEAARRHCLAEGAKDNCEHAVVLVGDEVVWTTSSGINCSVTIADRLLVKGSVVIHNHPTPCLALSHVDISIANTYGIEVIAVCEDGGVYYVDMRKKYPEGCFLRNILEWSIKRTRKTLMEIGFYRMRESDLELLGGILMAVDISNAYGSVFEYQLGSEVENAIRQTRTLSASLQRKLMRYDTTKIIPDSKESLFL